MTREQFLKIKVKPLEWNDDAPDSRDVHGNLRRSHAVTDTNDPRIHNRFLVFKDNDDNIFAASVTLAKSAVPVESFGEGKILCEQWHREYWNEFFEKLADTVVSFD
ncbi:MAG: hypothetical protein HDQ88_01250 [Clostridia bacterium]|nr:hypothetical protein [Clostridia bacterium]